MGTKRDQELTRKYLKSKHLRFLRRWQHRIGLGYCEFTMRIVRRIMPREKGEKKDVLASIDHQGGCAYTISLSLRTMRSRKDWRDSILHELMHVLFWELRQQLRKKRLDKKKLDLEFEELIVSLFSHIMVGKL